MQAKLAVDGHTDLYDFWDGKLARQLEAETNFILDLASKEYSRAILPHLQSPVHVLRCTFGERKDDRILEKGTMCKMARGQMVRWLAQCGITQRSDIRSFHDLDHEYAPEFSTDDHFVFVKGGA